MRAALLAILLLVAPLGAAAAPADPATRAAIAKEANAWSAAYAARDLDALMRLYEPDAWVFLGGQPGLKGTAQIRTYFGKQFAAPPGKIELAIEDIQRFGDVVQLVSLFRLTLPGERVFTGRSLLLYKRTPSGRWRIWRDIDNSTPDALGAAFTAKAMP
jgi:uncharacterized protein (TIGR02246 family)